MIEEHACLLTFFTARVLGAWTDTTNFNATKRKFRKMQGIFKKQMHYVQFSSLLSTHLKNPQRFHTHTPTTQLICSEALASPKSPCSDKLRSRMRMLWVLLTLSGLKAFPLGNWQLYRHCSEPCILATEGYPQLMNTFYSQEEQHRLEDSVCWP